MPEETHRCSSHGRNFHSCGGTAENGQVGASRGVGLVFLMHLMCETDENKNHCLPAPAVVNGVVY